MDQLHLTVEPPLVLNEEARRGLQDARQKARSKKNFTSSGYNGNNKDDGKEKEIDVTQYDVLERAWLDEESTLGKRRLPMSVRLQKLWSERGDFSRFRASDLHLNDEAAEFDNSDDTLEPDQNSLEINREGLVDEKAAEDKDDAKDKENENKQGDGILHDAGLANQTTGDVMSIEEMRTLRTQMLDRLNVAQNSLYFSHALVSLLINSTKAENGILPNVATSGRAGSAASASGILAQARAGGSMSGALQRSLGGGGGAAPSIGSASAMEAELGVEPYVFGASRIDAQRRQLQRRADEDEHEESAQQQNEAGEGRQDGEEDEEDVEDVAKTFRLVARQDAQLLDEEAEDKAKELVERYEGKRQGIRAAVDILRKGAATIDPANEGSKRERVRWRALQEAKQGGWSLAPGKPARITADKQRELLDDYSLRRKEEAARDAWIGYGVPESHPTHRRRALAYVSHSSKQGDRSADVLRFTSRPEKRMVVEICVGDTDVWTSEDGEFYETDKVADETLDDLLKTAQSELVDAELFYTLMTECRTLAHAGLYQAQIDSDDSMSIALNPRTKMRFIQKSTATTGQEREKEKSQTQTQAQTQTQTQTPDSKTHKQTSPLVTCILCMLRLGLIRRYRERAGLRGQTPQQQTMLNKSQQQEALKATLLEPLLGIVHYCSFVAHLQGVLQSLQQQFEPHVQFDFHAFDGIVGAGAAAAGQQDDKADADKNLNISWLRTLLQEPGTAGGMNAVRTAGGTATLYVRNDNSDSGSSTSKPVAFLTFVYPSQTSLTLPLKRSFATAATGVHLASVDLASIKRILAKELTRLIQQDD